MPPGASYGSSRKHLRSQSRPNLWRGQFWAPPPRPLELDQNISQMRRRITFSRFILQQFGGWERATFHLLLALGTALVVDANGSF